MTDDTNPYYLEGRQARRDNKDKTENPHTIESDPDTPFWKIRLRYHAWLEGWRSLGVM